MRVSPTRPTLRAGHRHALVLLAAAALALTACGPEPSASAPGSGLSAASPTGHTTSDPTRDAFGTPVTPASSDPTALPPGTSSAPVDDDGTTTIASSGTTSTGSGTSTAPGATSGTTSPGATDSGSPTSGLAGPLAGLQCRADVAAAEGSAIVRYETAGASVALRERQGGLAFEPVLLARGGEAGDVASALASYVALDAQGRMHYVEVAVTRDGAGQPPGASVVQDRVLTQGYAGARALGASVAFHSGGDPEIFVVDAQGRLLRHTLSAMARTLTLSEPSVLATGLTGVTGMSVETFDVDGDLAQELDVATRVLLADGDQVRQTIVRRDGVADPLLTVLGPSPELAGAKALTRAYCLRPGGAMSDTGALVVFGADGVGRLFGGVFTPAVAAPELEPSGALATAVPGLLAG